MMMILLLFKIEFLIQLKTIGNSNKLIILKRLKIKLNKNQSRKTWRK